MKIVAKTLFGLEQVLADELRSLGAEQVTCLNRAVSFNGDTKLLYKVNYCCRTALSFLVQLSEFRIRTKEDLYKGASKIPWDAFFTENNTISVVPVVNSTLFDHTGYPALVVKDAIADFFRKRTGSRPSVGLTNPDIIINVHISNDLAAISIDSSVISLFKRGYRMDQLEAPINEVLAAGIIKISGWDATVPLIDPMCGSGTIPIEAAMMASEIPAGKFRRFFGFQNWKNYNIDLFEEVRREADSAIVIPAVSISGSDISAEAVNIARVNAEKAGISDIVSFTECDFSSQRHNDNPVLLILNPPYGQRMQPAELDALYWIIGSTLKHGFAGSTAWIISSSPEALKNIGLKPAGKFMLYNGSLECRLHKYVMYAGTKKTG